MGIVVVTPCQLALCGKSVCWIYGFCGFDFNNLHHVGSGGTGLRIRGLPTTPVGRAIVFTSFSEGDEMTFGSFRFLFNRGFRPLHRSNMFKYNKVYDAIVYHGVHDDILRRLLQ
jgi:hypothetical protein